MNFSCPYCMRILRRLEGDASQQGHESCRGTAPLGGLPWPIAQGLQILEMLLDIPIFDVYIYIYITLY